MGQTDTWDADYYPTIRNSMSQGPHSLRSLKPSKCSNNQINRRRIDLRDNFQNSKVTKYLLYEGALKICNF
jgi:hypothetical protein